MSAKSYKAWYERNKQKRLAYNRRWRAANREECREQKRAAYHRNPEASKAKNRKWVLKNREKMRAYQRAYHAKNRKGHNEAMRRWRTRNSSKVLAQKVRSYRRKSRQEQLGWLKERKYVPVQRFNAVDRVMAEFGVNYG